MVLFAMIARLSDGLPLSASTDLDGHDRIAESKKHGKLLARKLRSLPSTLSMDSGDFVWHVIQSMGVTFMALAEYEFPQVLTFCFLDELQHEFTLSYDERAIQQARRPYCYVDFDGFLQKSKQRYLNPQTLHTRVPVSEMSRRLEEAPPSRMSAVAVLGSAVAATSASSSRRGGEDMEKRSPLSVKLLVAMFTAVLLLSTAYRVHLALELIDVDREESLMSPWDMAWSIISILVGLLCAVQAFLLVFVPNWAPSRQHLVLVPLVILLAALCFFGDWIYFLLNMCNASLSIGVAELTRSRTTKRRFLKQSA